MQSHHGRQLRDLGLLKGIRGGVLVAPPRGWGVGGVRTEFLAGAEWAARRGAAGVGGRRGEKSEVPRDPLLVFLES